MIINSQWATSVNNNYIPLYSSNELTELERPYLFIGGVHGDEPEGVALAQHLLGHLKKIKTQKDWALITCINPDGFNLNQRTNAQFVDLNRNFPSKQWSDQFSQQRYFPGKTAGSEPEVKSLINLIHLIQPKVIFHFHSWKPEIILTGPKNLKEAQIFSQTSQYPIKLDIGYPTPGSLGDFGWHELNIPVICIEEKERIPPEESWKHFKTAFEQILCHKDI